MRFSASALLLLPIAVFAAPTAESAVRPVPESAEDATTAEAGDIFRRSEQWCAIVNVESYANCRTGPGVNYRITNYPIKSVTYAFACYKDGDCVDGNCTWDKLVWNGGSCYVSGTLTDDNCTAARLGRC